MPTMSESPSETPRFLILGTAGHIDHGKTSLVKTITGTDTDRLPEEKLRGMTIQLGFAELDLGSVHFGVVDVPGHERFVRTMVAGATGIDLALLVVAGDDSVMPQTIEHVEILSLMGIRHAVVAISKIDMVDSELVDLVEEEVRELLSETPMRDAQIVRVSSTTGTGIEKLKTVLRETASQIPKKRAGGLFRLAIDRVFSVAGRGTVVTGSVLNGQVSDNDLLEVHPGGATVRVREMQSHGHQQTIVELGQRAALNLIGIDRRDLERGHELASPGYIEPSHRIDVAFNALSSTGRPIKPHTRVRICMGTREVLARIATLDRRPIEPGGTVFAQLRSRDAFFVTCGQRFIAREENDARTIGGGIVLRSTARRWSANRDAERSALETLRDGTPAERLEQVLSEAGFAERTHEQLSARSGLDPDEIPALLDALAAGQSWIELDGTARRVVPRTVEQLFDRTDRRLARYQKSNPDEPGIHVDAVIGWFERKSATALGKVLFNRYLAAKRAKRHGRFVCLPEFAPEMSAADERFFNGMLDAFRASAFQPPSLDQLAATLETDVKRLRRLAKVAVAFGELVEIDKTILLSAEHEAALKSSVTDLIRDGKEVTVAEMRERLNSSRKYAVPFMEYLDRIKFTVRKGDARVLCEEPAS